MESQKISAGIADVGLSEALGPALATASVLREYFPLQTGGQVQAVVGVWRDAVPILAELDRLRRDIVITTLSAALVAALALYLVLRSAQGRITRSTVALVEATRRDPLTGLLNHGELVGTLALAIETARTDGRALGIALVDIDGFRLLQRDLAVFLGERLGLDEGMLQILRVTGLLHDIGKIGIPDHILRKPGALTEEEYRIVKQHMALGDVIIRDLPNAEQIRAGVRHHHERWDGAGYLHGLAGEEIPLVARILTVGDAFSAMPSRR